MLHDRSWARGRNSARRGKAVLSFPPIGPLANFYELHNEVNPFLMTESGTILIQEQVGVLF